MSEINLLITDGSFRSYILLLPIVSKKIKNNCFKLLCCYCICYKLFNDIISLELMIMKVLLWF